MNREPMNSAAARLARLGFQDGARSAAVIGRIHGLTTESAIVAAAGKSADPDQAVLLLERMCEAAGDDGTRELLDVLAADAILRTRLLAVLGVSAALGEHLVRHHDDWRLLLGTRMDPAAEAPSAFVEAVGGDPASAAPVAGLPHGEALLALRVAYRRRILLLAALDLTGEVSFEVITAALSRLADAVLDASLAIARSRESGAERCRLAVIAMGKTGGNELNYISDVDVIFVAEPAAGVPEADALAIGTRLSTALMHATNVATAEGAIWEVDPNLRPEGRSGALVRTVNSHVEYYKRWASTWEFQALLKARAAAGDREIGQRYVEAVQPFVWSAAERPNFVEDVQAMRRRVERQVSGKRADRQLKLGVGGLRDVEFSVQLLQLVHGRSDVLLRQSNTMQALEALSNWGYVGRKDASELSSDYRFLRTMEHRLQLFRLRRTHVVPEDAPSLRRLGRAMGFTTDPVAEITAAWRGHATRARRLHEKLFYRPLLNAVARLDAEGARLTTAAAEERLRALGFRDPEGALRHLASLTEGVSRRALVQRTLLPVMLGWFASAPNPDAGLLGFRQVSDRLGATPWYLRLLRDESLAAERLALVLGTSRYSTDLLLRAPDSVQMLARTDDLQPRPFAALESEALAAAARYDEPEAAAAALRALRRRELFRLSVGDVVLHTDVETVSQGLTDIATAVISGTLQAAVQQVARNTGHKSRARFCIIAMGRYGGRELGYGSDADVMFVYEALPGAEDREAHADALAIANELRRLLSLPSADPPLEIDADLRPEGRNGPLVRSLASYAAYYQRWSAPWEAQALLRALAVAGDPELGQRFQELIDPLRYPAGGLAPTALREMRRLKARMESERLPKGADPTLHTKLGRGGLSDVEWTVQMLQMQHADTVSDLRTPSTLPALRALVANGLIEETDAQQLTAAWKLATEVRNATVLVSGRQSDVLPGDLYELAAAARVVNRPADEAPAYLVEEYRRVTRRARRVVERLFFGAAEG
jgi:glutamate-ammonia-ligase adenylyltransferase